jgi:hypothetical protein
LEDLAIKDAFIFYGHLVHFTDIWFILLPFGSFYCHLVHFTAIWFILLTFGTHCGHLVYFVVIWYIFPVLVCCTTKNLATLFLYRYIRVTSTLLAYNLVRPEHPVCSHMCLYLQFDRRLTGRLRKLLSHARLLFVTRLSFRFLCNLRLWRGVARFRGFWSRFNETVLVKMYG